jgi:hypothetical protein
LLSRSRSSLPLPHPGNIRGKSFASPSMLSAWLCCSRVRWGFGGSRQTAPRTEPG